MEGRGKEGEGKEVREVVKLEERKRSERSIKFWR